MSLKTLRTDRLTYGQTDILFKKDTKISLLEDIGCKRNKWDQGKNLSQVDGFSSFHSSFMVFLSSAEPIF